jgi:hypothetical protein
LSDLMYLGAAFASGAFLGCGLLGVLRDCVPCAVISLVISASGVAAIAVST